MKLAVLLITHNRIDDVKVSMEIVRRIWSKSPLLKNVEIYHAYNGEKENYPHKYLEDVLIYRPNLGHYFGAADLLDAGFSAISSSGKNYDYIFALSGDVWLTKPEKIEEILKKMKYKKYQLAATLWPNTFFIPTLFATEFFIITQELAEKAFPLRLEKFFPNRKRDLIFRKITERIPVMTIPLVEICFTSKVLSALQKRFWSFNWLNEVMLIPGRKVYFGTNRMYSKELGYFSHHDFDKKIKLSGLVKQVQKEQF